MRCTKPECRCSAGSRNADLALPEDMKQLWGHGGKYSNCYPCNGTKRLSTAQFTSIVRANSTDRISCTAWTNCTAQTFCTASLPPPRTIWNAQITSIVRQRRCGGRGYIRSPAGKEGDIFDVGNLSDDPEQRKKEESSIPSGTV
jgi:hypothetical protein